MTRQLDIERSLDAFLAEGTNELADHVLEAALTDIGNTQQRRSSWPARRTPHMNNLTRLALAAAATVAIAFVGIRLWVPGDNVGGSSGTPPPTSTPAPTATPAPTPAVHSLPGSGKLAAGRYAIPVPDRIHGDSLVAVSPVTAVVTIGDGWTSGGWYLMNPPNFSKQISFWTVGNVYGDICDPDGSLPSPAVGPTVDDLVSALDAQANTEMTPAADVTVGGFAGKRVTITRPMDIDCYGDFPRRMWVGPDGDPESGRGVDPGGVDDILILDVDGQRVVIVTSSVDADAAVSIAGVLVSMEFAIATR
jgi:hypothetical protein